MEPSRSSDRTSRWIARYSSARILGFAYVAIVCVVIGAGWFLIEILIPGISFSAQLSSALFLFGTISGAASIAISYFAEAQEKATRHPGLHHRFSASRVLATALLITAYIAMAGAFAGLIF